MAANRKNGAYEYGITDTIAQECLDRLGVDVITMANHAVIVKSNDVYFRYKPRVLHPINYPVGTGKNA